MKQCGFTDKGKIMAAGAIHMNDASSASEEEDDGDDDDDEV